MAILYVGDTSPLLEGNSDVLQIWPTGFIWVLNPGAVTLSSVVISTTLQTVCDFLSEVCASVDEPTVWFVFRRALVVVFAAIKRTKERLWKEPCFFATLALWLAQAVPGWVFLVGNGGFPVAFNFVPATDGGVNTPITAGDIDEHIEITDNKLVMLYSNVILAAGVAGKARGVIQRRHGFLATTTEQRNSSGEGGRRDAKDCSADSRVFSLLVGWLSLIHI